MKYFGGLIIMLFLFSCHQKKHPEQPVVKVFENYLYPREIADFIPKGTSREDSLLMSENYIRNWVTKQLLLHKASENLSGEERDIQRQVEDYRTSLLINRYKQKLITQRLKEDIPEEDIEHYYKEHQYNFILSTPIVKAIFFILPKSASNIKEVRKWYRSDKAKDLESLEEYCLTNAKKYDDFDDKWIEAKYILNLIPGDFNVLEKEILSSRNIEKEDEENYYFLKIKEIAREQTVAPLGYVKEEITLILKNKKKIQFENELEKQIHDEGMRKNYVKIY